MIITDASTLIAIDLIIFVVGVLAGITIATHLDYLSKD